MNVPSGNVTIKQGIKLPEYTFENNDMTIIMHC